MEEILPNFGGCLIHDFWKPFLTYDCDHGLCNSHHLRELTFLFEQQEQMWAGEMIDFLLDANDFVKEHGGRLTLQQRLPRIHRIDTGLSSRMAGKQIHRNPIRK